MPIVGHRALSGADLLSLYPSQVCAPWWHVVFVIVAISCRSRCA